MSTRKSNLASRRCVRPSNSFVARLYKPSLCIRNPFFSFVHLFAGKHLFLFVINSINNCGDKFFLLILFLIIVTEVSCLHYIYLQLVVSHNMQIYWFFFMNNFQHSFLQSNFQAWMILLFVGRREWCAGYRRCIPA